MGRHRGMFGYNGWGDLPICCRHNLDRVGPVEEDSRNQVGYLFRYLAAVRCRNRHVGRRHALDFHQQVVCNIQCGPSCTRFAHVRQ